MLRQRIISALILLPIVGGVVYLGGAAFYATLLILSLLAYYEYGTLVRRLKVQKSVLLGALLVAALLTEAQWPGLLPLDVLLPAFTLLGLALQVFQGNAPDSLYTWAVMLAGGMYVGLPLGYALRLRGLPQGLLWVALALVGTWISDSAAYFVGCAWGKRKLAPKISPHKTWEGALAGLSGALVITLLAGPLALSLSIAQSLLLGLVLWVAATVGDLAESVIKRQVGAKDSGNLIPGHGGVLDRLDSLLFVMPAVYWYTFLVYW